MKDQIHPVLDWGTKELEDMLQIYADRTRRLPVGKMVKVVSSKYPNLIRSSVILWEFS